MFWILGYLLIGMILAVVSRFFFWPFWKVEISEGMIIVAIWPLFIAATVIVYLSGDFGD